MRIDNQTYLIHSNVPLWHTLCITIDNKSSFTNWPFCSINLPHENEFKSYFQNLKFNIYRCFVAWWLHKYKDIKSKRTLSISSDFSVLKHWPKSLIFLEHQKDWHDLKLRYSSVQCITIFVYDCFYRNNW